MKQLTPSTPGAAHGLKFTRGFTLVEILVVVAIIAILAGLVVGLAGRASYSKIVKRAEAELQMIESAVKVYKERLGYYPQDNPGRNYTNALYNELTMTRVPDSMTNALGMIDIANMGPKAEVFLTGLKPTQYTELGRGTRSDDPSRKEWLAAQLSYAYGNVPWHYNSSSPTNNPDSFDLWVEITIGKKKVIVGNWKD